MNKLIVSCVLLVAFVSVSEAITCWNCNGLTCKDPFTESGKQTCTIANGKCKKTELNNGNIIRDCLAAGQGCNVNTANNEKVVKCCNNKDKCNSAGTSLANIALVTITSFIGIYFMKR